MSAMFKKKKKKLLWKSPPGEGSPLSSFAPRHNTWQVIREEEDTTRHTQLYLDPERNVLIIDQHVPVPSAGRVPAPELWRQRSVVTGREGPGCTGGDGRAG